MHIRVGVIGGGSWGTTVAHVAAHNAPTVLWARRADVVDEVNSSHRNSRYLDGFDLHPGLRADADLERVVANSDVVVLGVPSYAYRPTLELVRQYIRAWVPIVSLTKGIEQVSRLRMSEVANELLPGHPVAVLTGPNLAKEILQGDAAASVVATPDPVVADQLQRIFNTPRFRVFTNPDVIGCELGGAFKNVIAIAAGMADGLGAGDNTKAAVITRGLNELSRLGEAMGGQAVTFAGLAGMGDLIATCMSPHSRNRFVGEQLGLGHTIEDVSARMNMVAEGVTTSRMVSELAAEFGIDMPISREVYAVCHEGSTAEAAYLGLLDYEGERLEHHHYRFSR